VHARPIWLLAAAFLAGRAAASDSPPPPLTIPDLTGPRTLALEGGVGAATGSEAFFLNPAALAARKRYTVDALYLADRRSDLTGTARAQDYFGGSISDSSTTAVAAGFSYVRALKGIETGTLLRLALAAPLARGLFLGVQGDYYDMHGVDHVSSTLNADVGLFYQVASKVSVGAAGYNLVANDHHQVSPLAFGVGFAAGTETSLQVIGDWRRDLERVRNPDGSAKSTNRYSVGAEYLFISAVPVRGGFSVDDISKTKWWSLGVGWVSTRAAVDLGYRQSVTDSQARTLEVAVRVFVPAE
jgi:hypothetical protein